MPGPSPTKQSSDYGKTPEYDPLNEDASYNVDRNKLGSDYADKQQASNRRAFNAAAGLAMTRAQVAARHPSASTEPPTTAVVASHEGSQ